MSRNVDVILPKVVFLELLHGWYDSRSALVSSVTPIVDAMLAKP